MSEEKSVGSGGAEASAVEGVFAGQLYKYTNVVKGYQYRWFLLDPARGTLEYYMPDKKKKSHPRGCVYLAGSITSPSDEDSQTFTVNSASGESFKLRAVDAKERQFWVDKLRKVTLDLENRIASESSKPQVLSSLNDVRDTLLQTQKSQVHLVDDIEKFTATDEKLLLLKATSQSAIMSLEQSFAILLAMHHHRY